MRDQVAHRRLRRRRAQARLVAVEAVEHLEVGELRAVLLDRGVEASEITVLDERDGGTFFGFSDPDGNTWAVHQLKVRGEKPLIPLDHRERFGEGVEVV